MSTKKIELRINGELREVVEGLRLRGLLEELGIEGQRVAVALNGQVIPKSQHGETLLSSGDRVEIVRMVGGG